MTGDPTKYSTSLATQAAMLRQASGSVAASQDHPRRDEYCRYLMQRTADLADSSALFVHQVHIVAGQVIMRSLLEDLIKVLWATLSEDNARSVMATGVDQMKALSQANLRAGTGRIRDKQGNDHSEQFLQDERFQRSGKALSVEAMAREADALPIYNIFYRFASLQTHGNPFELSRTEPWSSEDVSALLSGIGAITKTTGHVAIRWLLHRERPSKQEVNDALGMK